MKNFEKLKNMTIDELENCLCEKLDCALCIKRFGRSFNIDEMYQCHNSQDSVIGRWLESEVE